MKLSTSIGLLIVVMVAVVLPTAGYFVVYGCWTCAETASLAVDLEFASAKTLVVDGKSKIPPVTSLGEFVVIGGRNFEVRPPWRGHRLAAETYPEKLDLAMLPVELVLEGRAIYVTAATRDAFVKMAAAAFRDGVELAVDSGYRSVAYQRRIYQRKMAEGEDFYEIARGVAPPGYSEHMLGTTLDLAPSKWTFNGTPAERWLLQNAAEFFFVQSYPRKSERGFTWEPWHWKYVGVSGVMARLSAR
jgi:D-alanyl-D-alanine carboxypeptidase